MKIRPDSMECIQVLDGGVCRAIEDGLVSWEKVFTAPQIVPYGFISDDYVPKKKGRDKMKRLNVMNLFLLSACLILGGCSAPPIGETAETRQDTPPLQTGITKIMQTEKEPALSGQNDTVAEETKQMQTTTYTLNGVDFTMILVEAGTFTMGSDNTDGVFRESPAHTVTISRDYLMGETEVTEALWNAVMGNGGGSKTMPKTSVTWNDAHDFIDRLNEMAHEQGLIAENENFKLPTEAEWEFAAKGGNLSQGYLYSGSNHIDDVAQTLENTGSNSPVAVKGKQPNELGLYDMSGNAYEWVDDYAGDYSAEEQIDPQNTTPSRSYVKRGGSNYHHYDSEPYLFTTTGRYFYGSTDWTIGFRIALR